jgi:hypothetical protein
MMIIRILHLETTPYRYVDLTASRSALDVTINVPMLPMCTAIDITVSHNSGLKFGAPVGARIGSLGV